MLRKYVGFISSKAFIKTLFYIIIYRLTLDICYFDIIFPNKDELSGFEDFRNSISLSISYIVLFGSSHFINYIVQQKFNWSNLAIIMLYCFNFVPFTTGIYAGMFSKEFIIYFLIYWFMLLSSAIIIPEYLSKIRFWSDRKVAIPSLVKKEILYFIIASQIFLVLYIWVVYADYNLAFNPFGNIYEQRLKARDFPMSTILTYLFSASKVVIPTLLGYCLSKRDMLLSISLLIISIISFGIDCAKGPLFISLGVIFLFLFLPKNGLNTFIENGCQLFFKIITVFSLAGILEYFLFHSKIIVWVFIRRAEFVVVKLMAQYYEFFSEHQLDFYRSTILRHFGFPVPYPEGISRMIGRIYYLPETAANNGLFSDAYTNFGGVGILFMPILLFIVIKIFDIVSKGLDSKLTMVVMFQLIMSLMNGFLLTIMIVNGYFIVLLIMLVASKPQKSSD